MVRSASKRFNKEILCIILFVFQFTGCLFAARQVN